MTKKFGILQKKVEELESDVNHVVCLPPETPSHQRRLSQDIQQRFLFVKNLLSAEIASRPRKQPRHLQHIVERLLEVESTFQEWDKYHGVAEKGNLTCSCLIDDDVDYAAPASNSDDDQILMSMSLADMEQPVDYLELDLAENKTDQESEGSILMIRKEKTVCLGSMASGVVLGMVLMAFLMLKYSATCTLTFHHSTFTLITPT